MTTQADNEEGSSDSEQDQFWITGPIFKSFNVKRIENIVEQCVNLVDPKLFRLPVFEAPCIKFAKFSFKDIDDNLPWWTTENGDFVT
ncbi:unnamed protein product [Caenorhabditis sp. 36 PRJEB53466]|nr:unnamed protein product [Caenorhabditis sp. 36 PRJEB53466]